MDRVNIADLEAELGCLYTTSQEDLSTQQTASSGLYEPPVESTSRLAPESKTKAPYPFGDGKSMAWASPSGELVQVASCVGEKLIALEAKKSLEFGEEYGNRAKALQKAIKSSQGAGYGLGVAVNLPLDAPKVFWVHNKWPRFNYQLNGLDIHIQYYIKSGTVVQQLQFRNSTEEEVSIPYTTNFDVVFRKHASLESAHAVPSGKSLERLMLFQNSTLVVQSRPFRTQCEAAFFQNGVRTAIWLRDDVNDEDSSSKSSGNSSKESSYLEDEDSRLANWEDIFENDYSFQQRLSESDTNYYRQYYKFSRERSTAQESSKPNFAKHNKVLKVPATSTQELCIAIKLCSYSSLTRSRQMTQPWESFRIVLPSNLGRRDNEEKTKEQQKSLYRQEARLKEKEIKLPTLPKHAAKRGQLASEVAEAHIALGKHYVKFSDVGQARFHFFLAILVAKQWFRGASREVCEARLTYSQFLYANGWRTSAKKILQDLAIAEDLDVLILVEEMQAAMYIKDGNLAGAELVYTQLHSRVKKVIKESEQEPSQLLERVAWSQASQGKYAEAYENYDTLRRHLGSYSQRMLLCNLAFLKQRLGQASEARSLGQEALADAQDHSSELNVDIFARSGLYSTFVTVGETALADTVIPESLLGYIDVSGLLRCGDLVVPPVDDRPLFFTLYRQLEYQLSFASIDIDATGIFPRVAFVDGDPLNSCSEARGSYYQFKFLLQCRLLLDLPALKEYRNKNSSSCAEYVSRIDTVAKGHLNWIFKTVVFSDTWRHYYPVDGSSDYELNIYLQASNPDSSVSRPFPGAYHFLKLYHYCCVYPEDWQFVLQLLSQKLDGWLSYLSQTQHKSNLWVADDTLETLWLRDLKSGDSRDVDVLFPGYDLSSSVTLWLALMRVEKLITMLEASFKQNKEDSVDIFNPMMEAIRRSFESHREKLDPVLISRNIARTFVFSRSDLDSPYTNEQDGMSTIQSNADGDSLSPIKAKFEKTYATAERKRSTEMNSRNNVVDTQQRFFAFRRSAKELRVYFEASDGFVLEAVTSKLAESFSNDAREAWNATLYLQQDNDPSAFKDPRSFALALLARKHGLEIAFDEKSHSEGYYVSQLESCLYNFGAFAQNLTEDAPEEMLSWSTLTFETMSLTMEALFKEGLDIVPHLGHIYEPETIPSKTADLPPKTPKAGVTRRLAFPVVSGRSGGGFSKINASNIVDDATFLPDWMYHYPDFIHEKVLDINMDSELSMLDPSEVLQPAVTRWKKARGMRDEEVYGRGNQPQIVDLGIKGAGLAQDTMSVDRKVSVERLHTSNDALECFTKPRTPELGKKRLIELPYCSADSALACWLSASPLEKPFLLEFFRRHTVAHNYFGERAHQLGNIWETEFHLAFYQFVDSRDVYQRGSRQLQGRPRLRELPTLSATDPRRRFTAAAIGFRFVGDLRDRFWTCHFVARNHRKDGFTNVVDDKRNNWGYRFTKEERFLNEKLHQRRVLEATYIDRATWEMKVSVGDILDFMNKELRTHDTRDPQNESFELIYNRSRLYFRAAELLRDMSQRQEIAINTITEWENREETRGVRSRWSRKDEERFGEKIRELNRQIRINVQQLKAQRNRVQDQLRFAEHRHTDLIGYMQLREARTSTRSAEDVRLFTYVTIIFLPLSFSSSLFSMAGTPESETIVTMIQVTVIALAITLLSLANMKLLDRYWTFWANTINSNARKKMKQSNHSWPVHWNDISHELEEAAQRQLSKTDYERHLPAESRWWYVWFWLSYLLVEIPAAQVSNAIAAWRNRPSNKFELVFKTLLGLCFAPTCLLIFTVQFLINASVGLLKLLWAMGRHWSKRLLDNSVKQNQHRHSSLDQKQSHEATVSYQRRPASYTADSLVGSSESSAKTTSYDKSRNDVFRRLNKPPKPFDELIKAWNVPVTEDISSESTKLESVYYGDDLDDGASDTISNDSKVQDHEDDGEVPQDELDEVGSNIAAVVRSSIEGNRSANQISTSPEREPKPASNTNSFGQDSSLNWGEIHRRLLSQGSGTSRTSDSGGILPF